MTDPVFNITDHPTLPREVMAVQAKIGTDVDGQFWDGSWKALLAYLDVKVNPIRWGVSVPGGPASTAAFEKKLGCKVGVNGEYFQAAGNPSETLTADKAAGRRTVLHVKPEGGVGGWKKPPSPAFLDRWAKSVNQAGGGVDLIPNHEPENDGGQPADYRNWGAQVQSGLRARLTVPDVRIGPCLMAWTISHGNPEDWIWTGVDFLAWDGYGSLPPGNGDRSPAQVFDPCVAINRRLGLPMLIAETSAMFSRGKQDQFIADLIPYCQSIADVLTDVIVFSSGSGTLNAASLAAYRKAFA